MDKFELLVYLEKKASATCSIGGIVNFRAFHAWKGYMWHSDANYWNAWLAFSKYCGHLSCCDLCSTTEDQLQLVGTFLLSCVEWMRTFYEILEDSLRS